MAVLHTGFFMCRGNVIVWPLGGVVACSPGMFLYSMLDSDLIMGGGEEIPVFPPLYATLNGVSVFFLNCM